MGSFVLGIIVRSDAGSLTVSDPDATVVMPP